MTEDLQPSEFRDEEPAGASTAQERGYKSGDHKLSFLFSRGAVSANSADVADRIGSHSLLTRP